MEKEKQAVQTTLLGEKLAEALAKKAAHKTESRQLQLPDLDKIEVPELSTEELKKIQEEGMQKRQWSESAGSKLTKIRAQIKMLGAEQNLDFSEKGGALLTQLQNAERQILEVDERMRSHAEFAALVEEVKGTPRENLGTVVNLLKKLIQAGRFKIAKKTEIEVWNGNVPSGTIFLEGTVYLSCPNEDGIRTPGQVALETEVRKLTDGYKVAKVAKMKMRGNPNLAKFANGEIDIYYFHVAKGTGSGGRKYSEGHLLATLTKTGGQKIIVVVEAAGSLAWMATGEPKKFPFLWLEKNRVLTSESSRLPEEEFEKARRVIKTLRELCNHRDV